MVLDKKLFQRVFVVQAILVVLGIAGFALARGKIGGLSYLAGATVGTLSLWILFRGVGMSQGDKAAPLAMVMMSLRLLIAGFVLYVILRTYTVHTAAAACGVLTHIVSIVLATVYDNFNARTP